MTAPEAAIRGLLGKQKLLVQLGLLKYTLKSMLIIEIDHTKHIRELGEAFEPSLHMS